MLRILETGCLLAILWIVGFLLVYFMTIRRK